MTTQKFRFVTSSDFDSLVCGILFKEMDLIDEILFVHPKDMQDSKITISERDVTTNLPYVEGVHLAFDHHISEGIRNHLKEKKNYIIDVTAPSSARVVYNYYGGEKRFPENWNEMMEAVDKSSSASFTQEEILNPSGWILMSFLMDPRTGLGRFHDFTISNYHFMMSLIDYHKDRTIEEAFEQAAHVKERVDLLKRYESDAIAQIKRCAKIYNNLVVLDLREEEIIYPINRFVIYTLFPECNISLHIMWGLKEQNTIFAIGKSIFNRTSNVNVGALCLIYGGGGHLNAGTCQVENADSEGVLSELIAKITHDG